MPLGTNHFRSVLIRVYDQDRPKLAPIGLERYDRLDDAAVAIEPVGKGIDHRLR